MGRSRVLQGAAMGAVMMVIANVAFAWFATAPDHYEWTDPAIYMSPFAAAFGAIAGAVVAALTRPKDDPRWDGRSRRQREKRRFLGR